MVKKMIAKQNIPFPSPDSSQLKQPHFPFSSQRGVFIQISTQEEIKTKVLARKCIAKDLLLIKNNALEIPS